MPNIKCYHLNQWDLYQVIASDQSANFPGQNTQHRWKTLPWTSPLAANNWIKIKAETGTTIPMNGIFVFYHNLTPEAIVKIQGSNDDFDHIHYEENLEKGQNKQLAYIPNEVETKNAWRIWIEDTGNPDQETQLGRVWLGDCWQPEIGYNSRSKWQEVNPSKENKSGGGQKSAIVKTGYMTFDLLFDCIVSSEFKELYSTVSYHKPFVILKKPRAYTMADYPQPANNSYYVTMKKHTEDTAAGNKSKLKMQLEEER